MQQQIWHLVWGPRTPLAPQPGNYLCGSKTYSFCCVFGFCFDFFFFQTTHFKFWVKVQFHFSFSQLVGPSLKQTY